MSHINIVDCFEVEQRVRICGDDETVGEKHTKNTSDDYRGNCCGSQWYLLDESICFVVSVVFIMNPTKRECLL